MSYLTRYANSMLCEMRTYRLSRIGRGAVAVKLISCGCFGRNREEMMRLKERVKRRRSR